MKTEKTSLIEDLFVAYFDARRNKRNTINQLRFEINFEHELFLLRDDIMNCRYEARPSICFIVENPVKREVFAADFRDRVVHHLLYNYMNPTFEEQFIEDSYSCRKNKGTLYGIKRVDSFIRQCSNNYTQNCYILKLDLESYFMSINKVIMLKKIQKMLQYGNFACNRNDMRETVDYLLQKVVFNDPRENCIIKGCRKDWEGLPSSKSLFNSNKDHGLPIGNLTSQLFSNVYLHDFDLFVKNELHVKYYGRYVDDFVLVHNDRKHLKTLIVKMNTFLGNELQLRIHPKKIYLQDYVKGVKFLGAVVKPGRIYVANRTKHSLFRTLHETDTNMKTMTPNVKSLQDTRAIINSYLGIMSHFRTYNVRRKALLGKPHEFLHYGYLDGNLQKFKIRKNLLNPTVSNYGFI
ncbi:MAG: RNA-directed DNA polymerase [Dysgonamonadaceae bacterium]|nr:RNA-directed DNA polymerase [Dysgonamonadaceae bacterium]